MIKQLFTFLNLNFRFVIPAALLLLNSCGSKKNEEVARGPQGGGAPVLKVDGYIVKTIPLTDNLELPGSIIANESTEVHPEISGRLVYLNVAEGKRVGKGALLGKIYDGDLVAQLNKLKVQVQVAQQTSKRYEELLKINGISQQEYDLARLSINNLQADMAIVRSNIMRTEIRAPFNGTLGLKLVSPGAYVTPATALTSISQQTQLKLDFTLPEKYTTKIKTGQMVSLSAEGNNKEYHARIIATESGIEESNRSLMVRAYVIDADSKLVPGQFVKVKTRFDPDPDAIMIPSQAVIPQARGKQVAVYRNGIASFEEVTTGARDSANVQVITGLKVGDTIITTGLMSLKSGSKVNLNSVKK